MNLSTAPSAPKSIDPTQVDLDDLARLCRAKDVRPARIAGKLAASGKIEAARAVLTATSLGESCGRWNALLNGGRFSAHGSRSWGCVHVADFARFHNWALLNDLDPALYLRGLIEWRRQVPYPRGLCSDASFKAFDLWLAREDRRSPSAETLEERVGGEAPDPYSWCRDGILEGRALALGAAKRRGLSIEATCFLEQANLHAAYLCVQPAMADLLESGSLPESTRARMLRAAQLLASDGAIERLVAEGLA